MLSAFPFTGTLVNHLNRWLGGNPLWKVLIVYSKTEDMLMREVQTHECRYPPHPTPPHTHEESSSGTVCDAIWPAWGDTEALFSVPFHSLEIYTINRAKKLWNILWWNIKEMRKSPLKLQFNQCKRAANTVKLLSPLSFGFDVSVY